MGLVPWSGDGRQSYHTQTGEPVSCGDGRFTGAIAWNDPDDRLRVSSVVLPKIMEILERSSRQIYYDYVEWRAMRKERGGHFEERGGRSSCRRMVGSPVLFWKGGDICWRRWASPVVVPESQSQSPVPGWAWRVRGLRKERTTPVQRRTTDDLNDYGALDGTWALGLWTLVAKTLVHQIVGIWHTLRSTNSYVRRNLPLVLEKGKKRERSGGRWEMCGANGA